MYMFSNHFSMTFHSLWIIHLLERQREWKRGNTERLSIRWLTLQMTTRVGPGKVKAGIQKLHLRLPHGWQKPKHFGHYLLPCSYISRKLDWKWKQNLTLDMVIWDAGISSSNLTYCMWLYICKKYVCLKKPIILVDQS